MSLLKKWLIPGVVAIGAVTGISLYSETEKIEADLTNRAKAVLDGKDMDWASIAFDGRDGTLTGTAPEEGISKWALELLAVEWGIRKVDDETDLLAMQSPYTWGLERAGDKLSMIGYLPYDLAKTAPDAVSGAIAGTELSSSIEAARGAPADIAKVVGFSSDLLAKLPSAKAMLIDGDLTVSAQLEDGNEEHVALFAELQEKVAAADLGAVKLNFDVPEPKKPEPVETDEAAGDGSIVDGFAIKRTADGVDLNGVVPSSKIKDTILGLAQRKFGFSGVGDNLTVKEGDLIAGLGSEDYTNVASATLQAVSRLGEGEATLSSEGLSLTGGAFYEGALKQVQDALGKALPSSLKFQPQLAVAAPGETIDAGQCQILLKGALEKNNIYFDSGKASISSDSYGLLDGLIYTAHRCKESRIQIEGHTDSDGNNAANQRLSEQRAGSVVKYLIAAGLAEDRLEPKGFGETKPVAGNDTAEGKAKNRRIEFVILTQ